MNILDKAKRGDIFVTRNGNIVKLVKRFGRGHFRVKIENGMYYNVSKNGRTYEPYECALDIIAIEEDKPEKLQTRLNCGDIRSSSFQFGKSWNK